MISPLNHREDLSLIGLINRLHLFFMLLPWVPSPLKKASLISPSKKCTATDTPSNFGVIRIESFELCFDIHFSQDPSVFNLLRLPKTKGNSALSLESTNDPTDLKYGSLG